MSNKCLGRNRKQNENENTYVFYLLISMDHTCEHLAYVFILTSCKIKLLPSRLRVWAGQNDRASCQSILSDPNA
jgi:hypothetical protein